MRSKTLASFQSLAILALGIAIFDPYRSSLPGVSVPLLAAAFLANLQMVKAVYFKSQPELLARKRSLGHFDKLAHVVILMCVVFLVRMAWELGASYFQHAAPVLSDPLPLNAMEGRETVKAWLLAKGRNIYPSMQSHPFLVTIYPPVYHAAIAAMSALTGWSIAAGRLVSLGSFLAISLLVGWWTLAATRSRLAAAAIVLVTLYDPVLAEWSLHARPDMLAWMLALAGAWAFWAAFRGERPSDRLALAAGVLLCLACFTKQQALPYLLGCIVWGLCKGRAGLRPVLVMGVCAAALGAAGALADEASSGWAQEVSGSGVPGSAARSAPAACWSLRKKKSVMRTMACWRQRLACACGTANRISCRHFLLML